MPHSVVAFEWNILVVSSCRAAFLLAGVALPLRSTFTGLSIDAIHDPCAFKNPAVSSWHYKFLPYNARELGVKIGTNIRVGSVKGTVKSVMHNDVFVEFDGGERVKKNVLFVLEHAVENQSVTSCSYVPKYDVVLAQRVERMADDPLNHKTREIFMSAYGADSMKSTCSLGW